MISTVEKIYLEKGLETDTQIINYKLTYDNGEVYFVPDDTDNRHYQEILEWVAEGNTITDNGGGE
jgi:hypothetical protein